VPAGKQPRAFELLASLLRQSGKIAVTRANLSGRSHPAIIRARGAELVLHTLHFGDEVRAARERPDPQLRPSAREMTLATQLVEHMSMKFDPTTTEDPYRRAVEEIAAGRPARPVDEAAARRKAMEENSDVLDLMQALQRSLKEKPDAGRRTTAKAARTAKAPKRAAAAEDKASASDTVASGDSAETAAEGKTPKSSKLAKAHPRTPSTRRRAAG
jgi:DNA end-binding protein Ku